VNGKERRKKEIQRHEKGLILGVCSKIADTVYSWVAKSFIGRSLRASDETKKKYKDSFFHHIVSGINGLFSGAKIKWQQRADVYEATDGAVISYENTKKKLSLRYRLQKSCENSAVFKRFSGLKDDLLCLRMITYGVSVFAMGLTMTLLQTLRLLLSDQGGDINDMLYLLVYSIVVLVLSLPIIFTGDKPLLTVIAENKLTYAFCEGVIGMRSVSFTPKKQMPYSYFKAFVIGSVIGIAEVFFADISVILILFIALYMLIIFNTPEVGAITLAFLLPCASVIGSPTLLCVAICIVTFVSMMLKFFFGKRSVHFCFLDFTVSIFLVLVLLGGFVSAGGTMSLKIALVYVCFGTSYFVFANLIRTKGWIKRVIAAVVLSSAIVSAVGLFEWFFGHPSKIWQDGVLFSSMKGRVVSLFDNPNVLAEFLILTMPLSVAYALNAKNTKTSFRCIFAFVLQLACLVFTWSRGAWLAIILSVLVLATVRSKRVLGIISGSALICLPIVPFVSQTAVFRRLVSAFNLADTSIAYRLNIWKGSLEMFEEYFFTGVGVGIPAFASVFPQYAPSGAESALHSHNLYLQIGLECGVIALIVFLMIVFLAYQNIYTLLFRTRKLSEYGVFVFAIAVGIGALLLQGFTDHVFYNYRIALMFWMMLGFSQALISKNDEDYNAGIKQMS